MNILNQLYFLAISHLPASTVATISGALESAFNNNVKPEMKAIGNIIMYIISGVLIIAFVVKGVFVWETIVITAEKFNGTYCSFCLFALWLLFPRPRGCGASLGGDDLCLQAHRSRKFITMCTISSPLLPSLCSMM